MTKFLHGSPLG